MIGPLDIMEAINSLLVGHYPECAVCLGPVPKDFTRPAFYIEHILTETTDATAREVKVECHFAITYIAEVDAFEVADARQVLQTQQAIVNLFRGGYVQAGDRYLHVAASSGGNENDAAWVDLDLWYLDERGGEQAYELMQEVELDLKKE